MVGYLNAIYKLDHRKTILYSFPVSINKKNFMYRNNDAQQLWYFSVSTIVLVLAVGTFILVMVQSSTHKRTDNHLLSAMVLEITFACFYYDPLLLTLRSWTIVWENY